ncbi:MAG: M20/M25/M40 family metallo-hydrolase [Thermanaerothrix sp.]|nr:M20/M25/M40 family metallo-hydrolase [Thermanaerothrix sp.]
MGAEGADQVYGGPECAVDTQKRLRDELIRLCRIPSPSALGDGEDGVMSLIERQLEEIREMSGGRLKIFKYKVPNDPFGRSHVAALLKGMGPRTVILTGHVDVVDASPYGRLKDLAFEPELLEEAMRGLEGLPTEVKEDLESRRYLFGRGVLDMKAGLVLEMNLLRELACSKFEAGNVLFCPVVDEERDSVGMRGALSFLKGLMDSEGLEYVACVNTEPCDLGGTGVGRPVYIGSVGKLMPFVLVLGKPSHVGEPWLGISAAHLGGQMVSDLDAAPWSSDKIGGDRLPPMACMEMSVIRESYSVTIPDMVLLYFNKLTVKDDHGSFLFCFKQACGESLKRAIKDWEERFSICGLPSPAPAGEIKILEAREVFDRARSNGFREDSIIYEQTSDGMDTRKKSLMVLLEAIKTLSLDPPAAVVGFLPPYYPPKVNRNKSLNEKRLRKLAEGLCNSWSNRWGEPFVLKEAFGGITDLSFLGGCASREDIGAVLDNMPGGGLVYPLDLDAMGALDVPVINIGVGGRDAHKWTERLDVEFSFRMVPYMLIDFVRGIFSDDLAN